MRLSLLFISNLNMEGGRASYDGVSKKILLEIRTLFYMKYDVSFLYSDGNYVYLKCPDSENPILICKTSASFHRSFVNVYRYFRLHMDCMLKYDCLYIRYEHISIQMCSFLCLLKQRNKQVKIVAELPTYMGKWEPNTSFVGKVKFVIKRCMDKYLPKHIDYMVTFDDHKKLWGIPTIPIENFVDVHSLILKKNFIVENEIHLLGVAMMTASHGFDRVIRGLAVYYNKPVQKKVYFHIIGDGNIKEEWQKLTCDLNLEKFVIFEGIQKFDSLDTFFDRCQMGVASLAIFRKRCPKASELKIREYIARGIPFIYSALEPMIENKPFCLKVPHDESPININEVVCFFESLNIENVQLEMRKFALANCTCESQFKKVFGYV